jgi:hypothetical protein
MKLQFFTAEVYWYFFKVRTFDWLSTFFPLSLLQLPKGEEGGDSGSGGDFAGLLLLRSPFRCWSGRMAGKSPCGCI